MNRNTSFPMTATQTAILIWKNVPLANLVPTQRRPRPARPRPRPSRSSHGPGRSLGIHVTECTKYALPKNGIYGFKDLCFGTFSSFRSRCWRWKKAKYYFYADGWCKLTFFCKFYVTCSWLRLLRWDILLRFFQVLTYWWLNIKRKSTDTAGKAP